MRTCSHTEPCLSWAPGAELSTTSVHRVMGAFLSLLPALPLQPTSLPHPLHTLSPWEIDPLGPGLQLDPQDPEDQGYVCCSIDEGLGSYHRHWPRTLHGHGWHLAPCHLSRDSNFCWGMLRLLRHGVRFSRGLHDSRSEDGPLQSGWRTVCTPSPPLHSGAGQVSHLITLVLALAELGA